MLQFYVILLIINLILFKSYLGLTLVIYFPLKNIRTVNESLSIKTVSVSEVLMLSQKIKNKAHTKPVIIEKVYFAKSK